MRLDEIKKKKEYPAWVNEEINAFTRLMAEMDAKVRKATPEAQRNSSSYTFEFYVELEGDGLLEPEVHIDGIIAEVADHLIKLAKSHEDREVTIVYRTGGWVMQSNGMWWQPSRSIFRVRADDPRGMVTQKVGDMVTGKAYLMDREAGQKSFLIRYDLTAPVVAPPTPQPKERVFRRVKKSEA